MSGDREPPDGGLTLQEAYDRHADPADLQVIEEANASVRDRVRIVDGWVGRTVRSYRGPDPQKKSSADDARKRLRTRFREALEAENLVAWGADGKLTAARVRIPATAWKRLRIHYRNNELIGPKDHHIYSVLVYSAEQAKGAQGRPASKGPASNAAPSHSDIAHLRIAVRKWLESEAQRPGTIRTKKQFFALAQEEFGPQLSENLFNEAWKIAALPSAFRRPGVRPKLPNRKAGD